MSKILLPAGIVAALLGAPVGAHSESLQWFGNQYDNVTYLAYGIPDTDYALIGFHCAMGDEALRIFVPHDAPDAVDGQQMTVTLSSGTGNVELTATGHFEEMDDLFHLQGEIRLDAKLAQMLSPGNTLTVAIEDTTREFPLAGASDYVGQLVATCGASLNHSDLELRITNATDAVVVNVLFSAGGVNDFDGDTYGNHLLLPGESTDLIIPDGKSICDFDLIAEFDEEAERDPVIRSQNLCDEREFVVASP